MRRRKAGRWFGTACVIVFGSAIGVGLSILFIPIWLWAYIVAGHLFLSYVAVLFGGPFFVRYERRTAAITHEETLRDTMRDLRCDSSRLDDYEV